MKRTIFFLVAAIILGKTFLSAAQDPSKIVKRMQDKYDDIKDAVIAFKQDVVFGVTKNEQTFTGVLKMKKANKYHIEIEDQTIVTDGKSVWSYSKINNQVLIDKYRDDSKSLSPDKLLVNVPGEYATTILGKEKVGKQDWIILKMMPNEKTSNVKWLKVWVDDDEYLMRKVQIFDISDNLTTYTVNDLKINTGLNDTQFQFSAPPDAEVVDLR